MTISIIGTFDNANTNSKGIAVMKFKFPFSEVANFVQLVTVVGKPLKGMVYTAEGDKMKLGSVMFKQLSIDRDGEAKFTIEGECNTIDLAKVYHLIDKVVTLKLKVDEAEDEE